MAETTLQSVDELVVWPKRLYKVWPKRPMAELALWPKRPAPNNTCQILSPRLLESFSFC